jgi:ABC-type branched-subunit amino acid transport system substrate-binding protein
MKASIAAVVLAGCSTSFAPKPCSVDTDCGSGLVCELVDQARVCVHASDAPIIVGESAPISGTNQALGTQMKLGIELAFNEQNAAGGIRGRQLQLNFRDDAYDPPAAEAAARAFTDVQVVADETPKCPSTALPEPTDGGMSTPISTAALERGPDAVIAELGTVGTPTMVRAAPVVIETHTLYFGAFTGATKILRDTTAGDCAKYIFNYRASYMQEGQATVDLLKNRGLTTWQNLISFDQNDTFGDAGYKALTTAYAADFPSNPVPASQSIARFRYTRNDDTSVPAAAAAAESYLASMLAATTGTQVVGVMMTDTYGAGSTFIQSLRSWQNANDSQQSTLQKATRLVLYFSNVSFVGPNALSDDLVAAGSYTTPSGQLLPYTTNVYVSQVVPNYQSDTSDVVVAYNKLIAAQGATPGFTSLEGYIAARVFIAGLLAHAGPFTPDALIDTFENLPDLSLGIGATAGFTPANHQYSSSVWGTSIQANGAFKNLYYWTPAGISFFE